MTSRTIEQIINNILDNIGIDKSNIRITSDINEFNKWIDDYLKALYNNVDDFTKELIKRSAVLGKMYGLIYPDSHVDIYLSTDEEFHVYNAIGTILQAKIGVKIAGLFVFKMEGCSSKEEINFYRGLNLIANSTITNLIEDAIVHSLISKLATPKYEKEMRKYEERTKKNLEIGMKKNLLPVSFAKWGMYVIDSVFFGKDKKVEKMVDFVSIRRDKQSVLDLISYLVKKGKDFDAKIYLTEDEKHKGLYIIQSAGKISCQRK